MIFHCSYSWEFSRYEDNLASQNMLGEHRFENKIGTAKMLLETSLNFTRVDDMNLGGFATFETIGLARIKYRDYRQTRTAKHSAPRDTASRVENRPEFGTGWVLVMYALPIALARRRII